MKSEFEILLESCRGAIERFVFYKLPNKVDGEDILQEVYLSAMKCFDSLRDKSKFKAWMLSIASNKCNAYYNRKLKQLEIPLEDVYVYEDIQSRVGISMKEVVGETLDSLADKDRQILFLYYFKGMNQKAIASMLSIPVGTVKSRLYTAKQKFAENYPYPSKPKGDIIMRKLPKIMPEVKITKTCNTPFEVKWEEMMGWFIVPKLGEECTWAIYDYPSRRQTEVYHLKVTGKASVHGIEGIEILAKESSSDESNACTDRVFVAQLTETHSRFLSESHYVGDVKHYYTFLDADDFILNWGFGDENCGNDIYPKPRGIIQRSNDRITCPNIPVALDVVGRYTVDINGKSYDTILVMDIELYNNGIMSETYLDNTGRTILWRRFNRDDWAFSRYNQKWSEQLPENERVLINGDTYVHWYDCITNYIL